MRWTNEHDDVLLHIMLEMRKEGKVIPEGFTSEGWTLITKEMQTKLGPQFSKDKLKNRMKSLKKWYSTMKAMLYLSGFGWDEERKKVTAEDGVWDDYIVAHPGANMYRSICMLDYYVLCEIFGDSIVDGQEEFTVDNQSCYYFYSSISHVHCYEKGVYNMILTMKSSVVVHV